ncbi:pregnancy zone protein-like [Gallus gallus]|uniref:pregnancy zone protein-like n=1 Tax=Gallus gallus TaxID=9031 RepID=UPI001F01673E|nr:pregnancy zone protein-like [Gallus gallus]
MHTLSASETEGIYFRYMYGKEVKGTVQVTLCQKTKRCPQDASKVICREYSGLTASKGCFTSSVSTTVLNLAPGEEDSKIYAEASLLEEGTGTCTQKHTVI